MPPPVQAILFDLDGTLIDSVHDLAQALTPLLKAEGLRPITPSELRGCLSYGLATMLEKAFAVCGRNLSGEETSALMGRFLPHYENLDPSPSCIFQGAISFLEQQKAKGIRLALITNKYEAATRHILHRLNLGSFFTVIVGGDSLPERKPHPLPLQHAMKALGVKADATIMIGDSPIDALAARDAEVPCIIMRHGYAATWPDDLPVLSFADTFEACDALLAR